MDSYPTPENEEERLATVARLRPDPERALVAFDRVARIARWLFDAPISLVTLVGRDQQEFLTHYGLELEGTPRDHSFCTHAIVDNRSLTVLDTHEDDRFRENPLVLERDVRFYAGAPMVTPEGHGVGSVCVLDTEPRAEVDPVRIAILETLSEIAVDALEQSYNAHQLAEAIERIDHLVSDDVLGARRD